MLTAGVQDDGLSFPHKIPVTFGESYFGVHYGGTRSETSFDGSSWSWYYGDHIL